MEILKWSSTVMIKNSFILENIKKQSAMNNKLIIPIFLAAVLLVASSAVTPVFSYKLLLIGDVKCTSDMANALKDRNPDAVVFLGDLCYGSSLSGFKSTYWNQFDSKNCVIGNHDSPEDGSSSIYSEAKKLCQETWRKKVENKTTVIIGVNTNGNMDESGTQFQKAESWLTNSTYMKGVKNVIFVSHKPAYTNPGSHHPVSEDPEVKTFLNALAQNVPIGIKVYYVSGHNHHMGNTADKTKFVSGAGMRSHYGCDTGGEWNFCNDTTWGYLQFRIYPDGRIVPWFYNTQGVLVK